MNIDDIDVTVPKLIYIDADRFNGTYSGGAYTAWIYGTPLFGQGIPEPVGNWCYGPHDGANGGDIECSEFWASVHKNPQAYPLFGIGETPKQAALHLVSKIEEYNFTMQRLGIIGCLIVDSYKNKKAFVFISNKEEFDRSPDDLKFVMG
jgi:hypothetical protein